jgi:hypothetical protein
MMKQMLKIKKILSGTHGRLGHALGTWWNEEVEYVWVADCAKVDMNEFT